jgi:SAM-dependent methyltransferase
LAASATPVRALSAPVRDGTRVLDPAVTYLDGSEGTLRALLGSAADLSSLSDELGLAARSWPEQYHLAPARANIVRALDFRPEHRVLEVGAGCGAITRYLGERCRVVDAVEPVEARAAVARLRTRDLTGVEVFVADLRGVPPEPAYDVAVVVGVLEYVGSGLADEHVYLEFLTGIARRLKPGGSLVLAIENPLGVKYLCGSPEDHTDSPFESVESYPGPSPARTFDRLSLESMLHKSGFVPRTLSAFPDYKMARVVMDDSTFEAAPALAWRVPHFPSPDWTAPRMLAASEPLVWRSLVRSGVASRFANSFVVVAGLGHESALWPRTRLMTYFSSARARRFAVRTDVEAGRRISFHRRYLADEARSVGQLEHRLEPIAPLAKGEDLTEVLARDGLPAAEPALRWWADFVSRLPDDEPVPLDAIPRNIIVDGPNRVVIDREWYLAGLSKEALLARGVLILVADMLRLVRADDWGADTVRDLGIRIGVTVGLDPDGAWLTSACHQEGRLQAWVRKAALPAPDDQMAEQVSGSLLHWLDAPLKLTAVGWRESDRSAELVGQLAELRAEADRASEAAAARLAELRAEADRASEAAAARLADTELRLQELDDNLAEMTAATAAAAQVLEQQRHRVAELEHVVAAITGSRSWRITAPLRLAGRVVRKALRRGSAGSPAPAPEPPPATLWPASSGAPSVDELKDRSFPLLRPLAVFPVPLPDDGRRRLTIVTDSLSPGSLFGGVGTAMIVGAMLAERLDASLRIVTRTQAPDPTAVATVLRAHAIRWEENVEFGFSSLASDGNAIAVHAGDLFLTTSWWSTWAALRSVDPASIVYLLQEDERLFYPSGDEQLLCSEVLADERIRFLINTEMLHDHLVSEGFEGIKKRGLAFEPAFPENLYFRQPGTGNGRRTFLFYARPNNFRNLFYRGLDAIHASLLDGGLSSTSWDFHFVGKDIPPVTLPHGVRPKRAESLPWPDYASLIRRVDVGLSLMGSPHPSYPPLDLAACGAVAVTNRFGPKQSLERYSANIICVEPSTTALAEAISQAVRLAGDDEQRRRNASSDGLSRSWATSLTPVVDKLARTL